MQREYRKYQLLQAYQAKVDMICLINMIRLICILLSITFVTAKVSLKPKSKSSRKSTDDAYQLLAQSIQKRLNTPINSESKPTKYDINTISSALRSLSTTQSALKKIDGTGKFALVLFYHITHNVFN